MWYVCDMDDGILRVELTRKAAKRWAEEHFGAPQLTSKRLGVGRYEYGYGYPGEDVIQTIFIIMGSMAVLDEGFARDGLYKIAYPYPNEPHKEAEL